jgi:hypothetical protein
MEGRLMTDIPLGFSFEETSDGFVLRNRSRNNVIIEMRMSPEEVEWLKAAMDFWKDRSLSRYREEEQGAARPIVVHQIATAVIESDLKGDVVLNIVSPSGHHMALAFPPSVASEIAQTLPVVLTRIANPTKQ